MTSRDLICLMKVTADLTVVTESLEHLKMNNEVAGE